MNTKKIVWSRIVLAFVLAAIWLAGKSFAIDDTLSHLFATEEETLESIRFVLVCVIGMYIAAVPLNRLTQKQAAENAYANSRLFIVELLVLAVIWGIYLIACYPGFMVVDSWWELNEYWGFEAFTTHHPPIHVLLLGICSRIGLWLGDGNIGIFLMVLVQAVFLFAVEAYALYTMRRLRTPRWLYLLSYITLLISPYYVSYITIVLKDTMYSAAFLLYVIELVYLFVERENYWRSRCHVFLWFAANIGVYVMRNNGKYVLLPVAVILCIRQLRKQKKAVRAFVMILLPLLLAAGLETFVEVHYDIQKGSIREALSLPFQQTARYVRDYPDEVTEAEHDAIDKVLIYDLIGFLYIPKNADNVKAMYREEATRSDLVDYFKAWLEMFFRHPGEYISATLDQSYYLWDPLSVDPAYFNGFITDGVYEDVENQIGVHDAVLSPGLREWTEKWKKIAFDIPVLRMLYNYGFYNVILLFFQVEAIRKKRWEFLVISVPLLISDLIIIAAPLIYFSPRYAFPILYALPVAIAFYIYCSSECRTTKQL
jgi:hypothetical protein